MRHLILNHEKVRFRHADTVDLSSLPSADRDDLHWRFERGRRRLYKTLAIIVGAGAGLLLLGIVVVSAIGLTGIGNGPLRAEAEGALQKIVGTNIRASLGPATIGLRGVEITDVKLVNSRNQTPLLRAGSIRFGVKILPLLTGNLKLGGATIADAEINLASLPLAGTDWTASMRDERGLFDPDRIVPAIFKPLHAAFETLQSGKAGSISLENVQMVLPAGAPAKALKIIDGELAADGIGGLTLVADMALDGRPLKLSGKAARALGSTRIGSLILSLSGDAATGPENARSFDQRGLFKLDVTGAENDDAGGAFVGVKASFERSIFNLGARGIVNADVGAEATIETGSGKIEFNRLQVRAGGNTFDLNGAVGPRPASGLADDHPVYRYEFVSKDATLAPEGSPEPPLKVAARVSGIFDPSAELLAADEMALKSSDGALQGTAKVQFVAGQAPGIELNLAVTDMPVAHAKQVWPWFTAGKARQWVFEHVFGGTMKASTVNFRVLPGRLGNGVPLSSEEVSAHFEMADTRFDTAGLVPPVRDASGTIDVSGNDFDVTLTAGSLFLPSGRAVTIAGGKMKVLQANQPPVIGKLDVDVSGDAAAVAELSTFEPINAMRFVQFKPDDLGGTVKGKVVADIPLQKGVDRKDLEWSVSLDFDNLSIAKPFEGQILKDASGTLFVEPTQALISAKGKLNGAPAEIDLTEPLRDGGPDRIRQIKLTLDDKARNALAPGVRSILSGPVKLTYVDDKAGKRVQADLTDAELDLPWVGWSKGAGVAATAAFGLAKTDAVTQLSDFKLSGKSFKIEGGMTLRDGSLASADFDTVTLNRGDNLKVDVDRSSSGGYAVEVSGSAIDARPLIKKYVSTGQMPSPTPNGGTVSKGGRMPISLHVKVASATGFNDQVVSGLKLDYEGVGSTVNLLSAQAKASSGQNLTLNVLSQQGRRTIQGYTADAGTVLKFLDIYRHMDGGSLKLALAGPTGGALAGQIDARDFWLVDEPKLGSLVSTPPPGGDRSLGQAVKKGIDTQRVQFERGSATVDKGDDYLRLKNGVLRGPQIGTTFQGTLYNGAGTMDMTGTFMPAYGLNRIFGELPIVGAILGNGSDKGLIGLTFRLSGDAKAPTLELNPLSVIAPGIFRSIFEYN